VIFYIFQQLTNSQNCSALWNKIRFVFISISNESEENVSVCNSAKNNASDIIQNLTYTSIRHTHNESKHMYQNTCECSQCNHH
jgi:hypothetical protein